MPKDCTTPGLKPGEVIYLGCTANATPVYRITGWDCFHRQHGEVTITPEQAGQLKARLDVGAARDDLAHIPNVDGIRVDGKLDDWKSVKPIAIMNGKTELAKVYLAWKADGLYAAWDVTTSTPWKTTASVQQFAFQGGAAVDLTLAPTDTTDLAGALRVVVAPLNGRVVAVEMLPHLPATLPADRRLPVTYETGLGKITFDRVAFLPDYCVAAQVKPGHSGYVVEACIPWYTPLVPKTLPPPPPGCVRNLVQRRWHPGHCPRLLAQSQFRGRHDPRHLYRSISQAEGLGRRGAGVLR